MTGWNPAEFVDAWGDQSAAPYTDVTVSTDTNETYIEFTSVVVGGDFELTILVNDSPLNVNNETQKITLVRATGGTFTITFDGQTTSSIAYDASAATVTSALEALSNISVGDVVVTKTTDGTTTYWSVEFQGVYLGSNVPLMTVTSSLTGGTNSVTVSSVRNFSSGSTEVFTLLFNVTQTVTPQNETQKITIGGSPTSGNFTLTYSGQTTGNIAYNANNAAVVSALEALSNIGVGDVAVTGGPLPNRPITVEFKGALAATDVTQMTGNAAGLTTSGSSYLSMTTEAPGSDDDATYTYSVVNPVASGDYRARVSIKKTGSASYTYLLETSTTFAHNASTSTIKAALAGNWRVMNASLGTQISSGKLFHADELTVTGSLTTSGSSSLVIAVTNSGCERFFHYFPRWFYNVRDFGVVNTSSGTGYGGSTVEPNVLGNIEIQRVVADAPIPADAVFNFDFEGTNSADCDRDDLVDVNGVSAAITKMNAAIVSLTPQINYNIWSFVRRNSTGTVLQRYNNFSYPFDLSSIAGALGERLHIVAALAAGYESNYPAGGTFTESISGTQFEDLFDEYVLNYNNEMNRAVIQYGSSTIDVNTGTGVVRYGFSRLAVNRAGNQPQVAVEVSTVPTATITISTLVQGGTTEISGITGGTWSLVIKNLDTNTSYTVGGIAWNATADEVEEAINDYFGSTVCSVTGGPLPLTTITVTFEGSLANTAIENDVIPAFTFSELAGGLTPEVIQLASLPTDRTNSYLLTVAPGRNSLVGPKGRITFSSTVVTLAGNNANQSVSIPLLSLSPEAIEEAFEELFGTRVVHVVQLTHELMHENVSVSPYGLDPQTYWFWYYKDTYLITWLYPYESPSFVTSFILSEIPDFDTLMPEPENTADANDVIRESYRVWLGFDTANTAGNPKHIISLAYSGAVSENTCTYGFVVEPQYATSEGSLVTSRRGIAQTMMNRMIRFVWCGVNEASGDGGADTPSKTYTPLAYSAHVPWNAGVAKIKHVLERMVYRFDSEIPDELDGLTIDDLDNDPDVEYTPQFFGVDNILVTGGLHLAEGLKVKLIGKLTRANFNFYPYALIAEVVPSQYAWNSSDTDPSQPQPRIYSFDYSKVFQPGNNTIVRYTLESTEPIIVSYNGVSIEINNTMTEREIQAAINGLSTLPRLIAKTDDYDPDKNLPLSTSDFFYSSSSGGVVSAVVADVPIIPYVLTRCVTVSGSVAQREFDLEMTGAGLQYSAQQIAVGNEVPEDLFTLTVTTQGTSSGLEVQSVSIATTPVATSGTFKLSFDGGTSKTSAIAYNASASTVAAAVTALGSTWACTGSGGPLPSAVTLTFSGSTNLSLMTVHDSTLTNGAVSVAVTTQGGFEGSLKYTEPTPGNGPSFFSSPENWSGLTAPSSGDTLVFDTVGNPIKYGLRQVYTFTNLGSNRLLLSPKRRAFFEGQKVWVSSTTTLPTGLSAGYYYIRNPDDECTIQLSSTPTGSIVAITGAGTGTHSVYLKALILEHHAQWAGQSIGLALNRSDVLEEHLCSYLTAYFASIELGISPSGGDGLSLGKFDTRGECAITVHKSSTSSSEGRIPAVNFLTNNSATTLSIDDASVGVAYALNETSSFNTLYAEDSDIKIGEATAAGVIEVQNGTLELRGTTFGSVVTSS